MSSGRGSIEPFELGDGFCPSSSLDLFDGAGRRPDIGSDR